MMGLRAGMPHNLGLLAEVHLRLGQPREALLAVLEGLKWVEAVGERFYEAELHRIGGQARRALGHEAEARESFQHAVRIARVQGAREYERHIVLALASPPGGTGTHVEAPGAQAPSPV
jgi:predicted negative regulator of RcsB-dependent stress response